MDDNLVIQVTEGNIADFDSDLDVHIGEWYFTDETWQIVGPYESKEAANEALSKYALYVG